MKDNERLDEDALPKKDNNSKKQKETVDIHQGSWLKSVVSNGKWYLLGSLAAKVMLFFLLRVSTFYMSTEEYGIFNTLNSIAQLLPIFISFGLDAAFGRFFHDFKKEPEKLKTLFSTVYWFVLIYGILMLILIVFSSQWWLEEAAEVPIYPYAYLTFIPPLFMQLGMFGVTYLRQSLMSKMTSLVETLATVMNIIVAIPLLVYANLDIVARLWGNIAASGFTFLVMTVYFVRKGILVLRFDRGLLKMALLFSIPLIPSIASKWINMMSDRLIIAHYTDMGDVGLYSLAAQVAMILLIIQTSISQVLQPMSISGLVSDKERTKEKMADFSLMMWIIMILANLGAFLFAKDVVSLLAEKSFEDAYIYIPILGFTFVVGAQYRFFSFILQYHKKTGIISLATVSSAIANVILNLTLIPIFGAIAAPFATVGAGVVLLMVISTAAQRYDKIELHWKELILVGVIYGIATYIGILFLFNGEVTIFNFFLKGIFFLIVAVMYIYIGGYWNLIIDYLRQNMPFLKNR